MQNAKPTKYTPFSGASKPGYKQHSFKGASDPKERQTGFSSKGGDGNPTTVRKGKK